MVIPAIHRIVEQHAATLVDAPALVEDGRAIGYRELNHRANLVARHLIDRGFRRGGHAVVRMERGADLATVLLAILKAGGCYSWIEPAMNAGRRQVAVAAGPHGNPQYVPMDLTPILARPTQPGPNLPILSRPSDLACVLQDDAGRATVLVPHATITALHDGTADRVYDWSCESSALALWIALMAGATLTIETAPALSTEAA
jgi:non-ribosomal peptide synthetase component F